MTQSGPGSGRRVIVAGATGFIGRALARGLVGSGYDIVVLTRDPGKSLAVFGPDVECRAWDGRTAAGWRDLVEGAIAVVNLAGDNLAEGRWTAAKRGRILRSRTDAGSAVVEAVRGARVKPAVVVQASAVGYYGSRGDEELDEGSPPGSGFLADVVLRWEDSTRPVEADGVRRVVVRSGIVLGHDGGALPRLVMPFRVFAGGPLGRGRQWFSWIHLADEVRAIRFLVERGDQAGVFNLTAPNPLTEREFCRAIGAALRRPCWLPVPGFLLRLLFGGKADETLLAGQRVLPRRLKSAGFEFRFPEAGAALGDLLGKRRSGPA